MPCSMYEGVTAADFAKSDAQDAKRLAQEAMNKANQVTDMLCRVLRQMPREQWLLLDPDVKAWLDAHIIHDAAHGRP